MRELDSEFRVTNQKVQSQPIAHLDASETSILLRRCWPVG